MFSCSPRSYESHCIVEGGEAELVWREEVEIAVEERLADCHGDLSVDFEEEDEHVREVPAFLEGEFFQLVELVWVNRSYTSTASLLRLRV